MNIHRLIFEEGNCISIDVIDYDNYFRENHREYIAVYGYNAELNLNNKIEVHIDMNFNGGYNDEYEFYQGIVKAYNYR